MTVRFTRVATGASGPRRRGALDDVSCEIETGEIVAVVGPAGAGKSAFLRLLAGLQRPSSGRVLVDEAPPHRTRATARAGYATLPLLAPPELTGVEWLAYVASHRTQAPGVRAALVRRALETGGLDGDADRRIAGYDSELERRLAVATAWVSGCPVHCLDEVLTGADTLLARALGGRIASAARDGATVVLASADLTATERLATRAIVLWRGRIVADVRMTTLAQEQMAELALPGGALGSVPRLHHRFPESTRTGDGIAIPLTRGLTLEAVLGACAAERIPVASSRVRYRMLEDILAVAAKHAGECESIR